MQGPTGEERRHPHAQDGHRPQPRKQHAVVGAAGEEDGQVGRVGARDQQIYRTVIKDLRAEECARICLRGCWFMHVHICMYVRIYAYTCTDNAVRMYGTYTRQVNVDRLYAHACMHSELSIVDH